mmetsp:Transcript_7628/g.33976  ORF Transcript_7628/g.33976 Transcript_7628/m.33976 type:complete len:85 (-) Transcript_7628:3440-3694(-)
MTTASSERCNIKAIKGVKGLLQGFVRLSNIEKVQRENHQLLTLGFLPENSRPPLFGVLSMVTEPTKLSPATACFGMEPLFGAEK